MKKNIIISIMLAGITFSQSAFAYDIPKVFDWAKDGVEYCLGNKIMNGMGGGELALDGNLTREQMAKLLVVAFDKLPEEKTAEELEQAEDLAEENAEGETAETEPITEEPKPSFSDVSPKRWSYKYIEAFKPYMKNAGKKFNPEEKVTREEFAASLVLISGLNDGNVLNKDILEDNFDDADEVSKEYQNLLCIAVEKGYMQGMGTVIMPKGLLTRAQTCVFIYRVLESKAGNIKLSLAVRSLDLTLMGESTVTLAQAKAWAEKRGAHQRYIDIADLYWQYGELTGIRPEILYAQAAKETGFGKYTGNVIPEQNNWAGIKTKTATGDTTYDHESFATPEDGVRAHFNHMSAYIGLEPVGEPHGRYYSVKSIAWAGSVEKLAELGGKWCPDLYYGYSIYYNYLVPMQETEAPIQETEAEQESDVE